MKKLKNEGYDSLVNRIVKSKFLRIYSQIAPQVTKRIELSRLIFEKKEFQHIINISALIDRITFSECIIMNNGMKLPLQTKYKTCIIYFI